MRSKPTRRDTLRKRIAPGIWEDAEGNIHWSITELMELVGMENTPENQHKCRNMLEKLIAKNWPEATIIQRDKPDGPMT